MTSNPSSDDPAITDDTSDGQDPAIAQVEASQVEAPETVEAPPPTPPATIPPATIPPATETEVQPPVLAPAVVDIDDDDDEFDDEETEVQDMGQLLDSMEPIKPLRRGEVVDGEVMGFSEDGGILVNIGHKSEGVVQQREMRSLGDEEMQNLRIGDKIITYVLRPESADNAAILSIDRALGETGWRELEKCLEDNETVEGSILGFNKGGAIVDVRKVQGFVPMSQLVSVPRDIFRDRSETEEDPDIESRRMERQAEETGKTLQLKILEINRSRNRAIFSERQAVQEWRDAQKARLVEELQVGEVRKGVVTGISSFGAFVDLGGADGLVHISEMSWGPVGKPEDVVSIGDELDVFVLRVDIENKKIALSLRRLEPEPWETIHERLHVDDIVDAQITKLTNFGAFARVEGNIEGLIHISELSDRVIGHPREVVQEGEDVRLKVLRIEPERRRLGLSLKQTTDNPFLSFE